MSKFNIFICKTITFNLAIYDIEIKLIEKNSSVISRLNQLKH